MSILNSIKKNIGVAEDYTVFDPTILMHINSVFSTLTQLGVGPSEGFMIEDNTADWPSFIGVDPRLNAVKTYVTLRVRLLFDPPETSFAITAIKEQIQELEWRLNVQSDIPTPLVDADLGVDGGTANGV